MDDCKAAYRSDCYKMQGPPANEKQGNVQGPPANGKKGKLQGPPANGKQGKVQTKKAYMQ